MSITLRPYRSSDATIITSWIKSEYLMRQWCADRYEHYPVTPKDMNAYHDNYIDGDKSCALTMCDGDEILGYITLRSPADDPSERRIGFVIVDDSMRGRGLVKALVGMTADYAFTELDDATKVFFGIFENSISAMHCYEAVVFRCVSRPEI